jgi:hypothetical protein
MAWGKYAPPKGSGGGGGGLFLKLEPGDRVEFLVPPQARPHQRYRRWDQKAGKYEDASPGEKDAQCRILLPVVRAADNDVKILEMAPSTWVDLIGCLDHPRVGGVEQIYEISRQGAGKDTRWKLQRIDRAPADQVALAGRVALPDMDQYGDPVPESTGTEPVPTPAATSSAATPAANKADDDIPF